MFVSWPVSFLFADFDILVFLLPAVGPISATIHVSNAPDMLEPLLASLDEMYKSSPLMSIWVVNNSSASLTTEFVDWLIQRHRDSTKFNRTFIWSLTLSIDNLTCGVMWPSGSHVPITWWCWTSISGCVPIFAHDFDRISTWWTSSAQVAPRLSCPPSSTHANLMELTLQPFQPTKQP